MANGQPFGYVVFDPATGALTESCYQVPPEPHAGRVIAVDEVTRADWLLYRANEARNGVELAPAAPAAPAEPLVPQSVTRRQARQALLLAGLLDNVAPAIAALDDGTPQGAQVKRMAEIEWEDSLEFMRTRPLVAQIGAAIGLDAAGLDELFIQAAGL
jgi:hypothetical protein